MGLGSTVRSLLLSDAAVAAIVGARVYPLNLPQNPTFPAVTYQRISRMGVDSQDGPNPLARARVQLDAWAKTNEQAITLGAAIRRRLNGYRGPVAGEGDVQRISLETNRDLFDSELLLYRHSADFFVWHVED